MKHKISVASILILILLFAVIVFPQESKPDGGVKPDTKKENPSTVELTFIQEFIPRYQQIMAKFMTLRFKDQNVKIKGIDTEKLTGLYRDLFKDTGIKIPAKEKILSKIGLFPNGYNLLESFLQMYGQAANAFFDPMANEIFLDTKLTPDQINAINRLSYEKRKKKVEDDWSRTLVHELTHALQYQNTNLFLYNVNNDTNLAIRSLCEGEASLAGYYYTLEYSDRAISSSVAKPDISFSVGSQGGGLSSGSIINLDEQAGMDAKAAVKYYLASIASQFCHTWDTENIPENPYLWRVVMFPYCKGMRFAQKVHSQGNWEAIAKLYANPPLSTEQIIHPDKYNKDFPQRIKLPGLAETLGDKWRLGGQEIIGQLGVELMFRELLPKDDPSIPSEGWDGDSCALYENPETGQSFLAWYFAWDWYLHANEFFNSYKKVIGLKYKYAVTMESIDNNIIWADGETVKMPKDVLGQLFKNKLLAAYRIKDTDNVIWLEKRSDALLLLEDIPEEFVEAVREKIWKSVEKKEVRSVEEYLK